MWFSSFLIKSPPKILPFRNFRKALFFNLPEERTGDGFLESLNVVCFNGGMTREEMKNLGRMYDRLCWKGLFDFRFDVERSCSSDSWWNLIFERESVEEKGIRN